MKKRKPLDLEGINVETIVLDAENAIGRSSNDCLQCKRCNTKQPCPHARLPFSHINTETTFIATTGKAIIY